MIVALQGLFHLPFPHSYGIMANNPVIHMCVIDSIDSAGISVLCHVTSGNGKVMNLIFRSNPIAFAFNKRL